MKNEWRKWKGVPEYTGDIEVKCIDGTRRIVNRRVLNPLSGLTFTHWRPVQPTPPFKPGDVVECWGSEGVPMTLTVKYIDDDVVFGYDDQNVPTMINRKIVTIDLVDTSVTELADIIGRNDDPRTAARKIIEAGFKK